jgi:N-acetylneuraminic acid mutarotase
VKWTHVTPPWPPRRECAAFVCADRMFVIGGYNVKAPMGQCLGDIWSTGDADGRNWDRWQDVPWGPRSQQSAVVTEDNTIYILGGYEVRANVSYNDVWIGENGGLTWRRLIEHAPWEPRGYAATAWFNQGVWLFGGFRSNTLGDAWYWQPGRGDWAPVTAPTGPRFDAKAFVLNGKLYMVGGNANPGVGASDILCTGDLSHWTTISGGARWGGRLQAGIGPFKSRIYVAGGVAPTGTPLTDVWSYTVRDAGQPGGVFAGV